MNENLANKIIHPLQKFQWNGAVLQIYIVKTFMYINNLDMVYNYCYMVRIALNYFV